MEEAALYFPMPYGFEISIGDRYLDQACAIIFYMPSMPADNSMLKRARKKPGQLWVFWSNEPQSRHEWQYNPEVLNLFDIMVTFRLDSDVPIPYFSANYFGLLRREPSPKQGFINAFVPGSFDQSGRLEYLKELMSFVPVDSYDSQDSAVRQATMSRYKFSIVFEDAIEEDYVTGQFFDPLIAGSVPVYLGAPNIAEFAPGDNCYIDVQAFPAARDLANYLMELENDSLRLQEFLNWKTRPFRLPFNLKAKIVAKHPIVQLCSFVKDRLNKYEMII